MLHQCRTFFERHLKAQFWLCEWNSTAVVSSSKEQFKDWQNLFTAENITYEKLVITAQEKQSFLIFNILRFSAQAQSKQSTECCPRNGKACCDEPWLWEGTQRKKNSRLTFSPNAPLAGFLLLLVGAGNPAAHPNPSDCHRETWKIQHAPTSANVSLRQGNSFF